MSWQHIKELARILVFHPVLFAIYPVLFLYAKNQRNYAAFIILQPLVLFAASSVLLLVLLQLFLKNYHKAGVYLLVFEVWFFSYSGFHSLIRFEIFGLKIYRHQYMMVVWLVLLLLIFVAMFMIDKRLRPNFRKLTPYFNAVSVMLICFALVSLAGAKQFTTKEAEIKPAIGPIPTTDAANLPDIYYIILDAYTGQKELHQLLGFNDSNFIERLRKMGFYVAPNSHSNYSWTTYSLASSLNMQYLPMVPDGRDAHWFQFAEDLDTPRMIGNNRVLSFLKAKGYSYVDLSIWGKLADKGRPLPHGQFQRNLYYGYNDYDQEFYIGLIKMTFLAKPLAENYFEAKAKRETIIEKFKELENVPHIKGPKFTYAHFLIPHPPYVFDQRGDKPSLISGALQLNEKTLYLNQLIYANECAIKAIETILKDSEAPPIIIIQGDHGAWELSKNHDENVRMRMNILNAYYLPHNGASQLYTSVTPVNTFRIVFNKYFGAEFPLLEDKSYYNSSTPGSPLVLVTPQ